MKFVIVIRDPLNVALSLEKRDGIPIRYGGNLWHKYIDNIIKDTEKDERLFTFYEDYFIGPLDELARLLSFCGLTEPKDLSDVLKTIDREQTHHCRPISDLLDHPDIPDELKLYYLGLKVLSRSGAEKAKSTERDKVKINTLSMDIQKFRDILERTTQKLQLSQERKLTKEDIPIWLSDLREKILEQQKSFIDQSKWIIQLQTTVQELQQHINLRDVQLKETQYVLELRDRQLQEVQQVLELRNQHVKELQEMIFRIKSSMSWKCAAPLRLLERYFSKIRSAIKGQ